MSKEKEPKAPEGLQISSFLVKDEETGQQKFMDDKMIHELLSSMKRADRQTVINVLQWGVKQATQYAQLQATMNKKFKVLSNNLENAMLEIQN